MSHCARSQMASASGPLIAVITSKYSAVSRASISLTLATTSSTTRTRADMAFLSSGVTEEMTNRFDELADRDRLGQVSLAAAAADTLFVTLHGEGGDRDDRNGFQLRVVLQPFGDFEP